jgi:hypothetical protein
MTTIVVLILGTTNVVVYVQCLGCSYVVCQFSFSTTSISSNLVLFLSIVQGLGYN